MSTANIPFPDEFPVRMVGLRQIKVDHGVQSRCVTDPAHSAGIRDFVLKNGPISEPIVLFDDGDTLWTADGFHRIDGYRQASKKDKRFLHIRAEIRPGTREDAIVFSAGANQKKTYLDRKPEDIRRALFLLFGLKEWWTSPIVKIYNHVGVSPATVRKYRVEYKEINKIEMPSHVVRSEGSLMPTNNKPYGSARISKMGRSHGGFQVTDRGVHYRLGTNEEDAKDKLNKILEEKDSFFNRYENPNNINHHLNRAGLHPNPLFGYSSKLSYLGIRGSEVRGIAITWESFREKKNLLNAVGRVLACKTKANSDRAVVLCPVDEISDEVLDLYRKQGIEFMTIEDFIASLKANPETPGK